MIRIVLISLSALVFLYFFFLYIPLGLWVNARTSGLRLSLWTIMKIRFKGVPPQIIIKALIAANDAGLDVTVEQLEQHYLRGGNIFRVMILMLEALKEGRTLLFEDAAIYEKEHPGQ